jgi:hypothetical protein
MKMFNDGDWVYYDFELYQVKGTRDNYIDLTTGYITTSTPCTENVYPIDLSIKVISEGVEGYSKRLHQIRSINLNYPDLHRELVRRWIEIIDHKNNKDAVKTLWNKLDEFVRKIEQRSEDLKYEEIDGVKLIRR